MRRKLLGQISADPSGWIGPRLLAGHMAVPPGRGQTSFRSRNVKQIYKQMLPAIRPAALKIR
jgi:hypothetical protein